MSINNLKRGQYTLRGFVGHAISHTDEDGTIHTYYSLPSGAAIVERVDVDGNAAIKPAGNVTWKEEIGADGKRILTFK